MIQQGLFTDFVPKARLIDNVTISSQAEVTTTEDHGYEDGQVVRVIVPRVYGMHLYDSTSITVTGATTFLTDIDTSNQYPFVAPIFIGTNPFTEAQVVPVTGVEENIIR